MEIWQMLLLMIVGSVAGFVNVMAGGGSLLTMPVMIFMGMNGPVANGTNRVALTAQNISAVIGFLRKDLSEFKLSLTLSACALPGAEAGAYLGTKLDGVWFNRVLAGVMVAVIILMALKKRNKTDMQQCGKVSRLRVVIAHVLMVAVGVYGGFIQAGVGFILMAILHRVLGLDLVRVNMHKVFIVGIYMIVALAIFAYRGNVVWSAGLFLAVGNATGAWIGTHFAVKKGEGIIKIVLYIALVAMAIKLALT